VIGGSGEHTDGILVCIQFDADSLESLLYSCEEQEEVTALWHVEMDDMVCALASCPGGGRVAAASRSRVTTHSGANGDVLHSMCAEGIVYTIGYSPSGDWIAAAGSDEQVHVFDVRAGTRRIVLARNGVDRSCCCNTACINALLFLNEGTVLSGGYDKEVTAWNWNFEIDGSSTADCSEAIGP
jgi:hypothetical protein